MTRPGRWRLGPITAGIEPPDIPAASKMEPDYSQAMACHGHAARYDGCRQGVGVSPIAAAAAE